MFARPFRKALPSINAYGRAANEPLDFPPGGNGRMYGITVVREDCPSGTYFQMNASFLSKAHDI